MLATLKGPVPKAFPPECASLVICATVLPSKTCMGMIPCRRASGNAALGAFRVNWTVLESTLATWIAFQYWSVGTW